jgi:trans-aconitate methyltransferase
MGHHQRDPRSPAAPRAFAEPGATTARAGHWDTVYSHHDPTQVSWFQHEPQPSLDLITALAGDRRSGIIDAGGGASPLAARLLAEGFTDVTVLDISAHALHQAKLLIRDAGAITWICADLLTWQPNRTYRIWHDRAVFHFLTDPADRATYLTTLHTALAEGGAIVLGTFAADGPTHCSGLPVTCYSAEELADELTSAFGNRLTVTGSHLDHQHTPAGTVQPFTWITARLRPLTA